MLNVWGSYSSKAQGLGLPPLHFCQSVSFVVLCFLPLTRKEWVLWKQCQFLGFALLQHQPARKPAALLIVFFDWFFDGFCFVFFVLLQAVLVACFFVCLLACCFFFLLPALEQLACSFPPSALSWRAFVTWVRLREVDWGRSLRVSVCMCVRVFDFYPFGRLWKNNLHVGCLKLQLGEKLLIPGRRDSRKRSSRRRRRRRRRRWWWWWWWGRWWCCCCRLCFVPLL